jgi:cobyrinic acid a,c-diamide synthase
VDLIWQCKHQIIPFLPRAETATEAKRHLGLLAREETICAVHQLFAAINISERHLGLAETRPFFPGAIFSKSSGFLASATASMNN